MAEYCYNGIAGGCRSVLGTPFRGRVSIAPSLSFLDVRGNLTCTHFRQKPMCHPREASNNHDERHRTRTSSTRSLGLRCLESPQSSTIRLSLSLFTTCVSQCSLSNLYRHLVRHLICLLSFTRRPFVLTSGLLTSAAIPPSTTFT